MENSLSSRLQMAMRRITGRGKLTEKDIDEISMEIKKGLEIVFVEQMKDVLEVAFVK